MIRKIKYTVFSLIFIISVIILGELYVYNLESFSNDYVNCTFSINQISDMDKAKKDIEEAARAENIGIFVLENKLPSEKLKEFHIYGNTKAVDDLKKTFNNQKGYKSLVVGKTKLVFHDWKEITNIDLMDRVFFSDGRDNLPRAREFKSVLIAKYGGGFPKDYGRSKTLKESVIAILSILYLVLILLTLFELQIKKKENFVRLIQGEDILKSNLKLFLKDELILAGLSIVFYFIFSRFYYLGFLKKALPISFIIQMLISGIIYTRAAKDIEDKGRYRMNNSKVVIRTAYVVRFFVIFILAQLIYTNALVINQGIEYARQEEFFRDNKEYSYYQLNYRLGNSLGKDLENSDDTAKLHDFLNNRYYNKSMLMFNFSDNLENQEAVLLNKQALEKQKIDLPLDKVDSTIDLAIFTQKDLSQIEKEDLKRNLDVYYPEKSKVRYYKYNKNLEVIAINNTTNLYRSSILKSPIIILENKKPNLGIDNANARLYFAYSIPYSLEQVEFNKIIKDFKLENQISKKTNILDSYIFGLKNIRRSTSLLIFMTMFFVVLNLLILSFIIRMQYYLHKKELVLKTILGYKVSEKNRKLIGIQIGIITMVLIISTGCYISLSMLNIKVLAVLIAIILIIEVLAMIRQIWRNEKQLLAQVVKGG